MIPSVVTGLFIAAAAAAWGGDATNAPPTAPAPAANTNEVAVLDTTDGQMVIEFWPDVAPNTVANFKKLARQGFYKAPPFIASSRVS